MSTTTQADREPRPGVPAGTAGVAPAVAAAADAASAESVGQTAAATVADLERLLSVVAEVERLQAEAVALAGRLAGAGVAERSAGLPLDLLLAADAGLTAYVVDVDVSQVDASQPGRLRLRLPGAAPRLSGRRVAADAAEGADVRVVITDGAAPLGGVRPGAHHPPRPPRRRP